MTDAQHNILHAIASDLIKLKAALGLQHFGPGGEIKSWRGTDKQTQRLSVDVREDDAVSVRPEGIDKSVREDEVSACQILIDRFNKQGGQWAVAESVEENAKREDGVDVIARHLHDKAEQRKFQVIRIDPDKKLWRDLGKTGVGEKIYAPGNEVANAVIYEAIQTVLHKPQHDIILVLNGTQLPIALPSVCDAFEKRHGSWLREQLKFREVWVVQSFYDEPWTYRLLPK